MRRRCSARCCSRTFRNTASSRAARAGSRARRLLHGAECRGRGPRRRRATASRIESVLPYSRQHAAKRGGIPRLRRRAALAATLLAAPARPSRFRLSSLCTPGAPRGATALAFARFGFRGPAGPALLSRALRGRLAPRPGALASRPWLGRLRLRHHLALYFQGSGDRSASWSRSTELTPRPLCGVLRFVPADFSADSPAVLSRALRGRLAPRPGALASRPWLGRLRLRRHLALSFHRSGDRSASRGRSAELSPRPLCGVLRFVPAAFSAAVAAVLTLLLHCRLRARALSRARRRFANSTPPFRHPPDPFLLEAVCARSRVAGRGATDDIIHREHDVFNSPAWRGSVRSVAAHTLDPTVHTSSDDARHLVTLRTSASVHARPEENHALFHNPSGAARCSCGVRANVRRPSWRIHPDRRQRCVRG